MTEVAHLMTQDQPPPPASRKRPSEDAAGAADLYQPADVVYRLLCPVNRTGGVIGKGGENINAIRHETFARLKVEDAIPGCSERVVTIHAADSPGADLCAAQAAFFRVLKKVYEDEGPDGPILPFTPVCVRVLLDKFQVETLSTSGNLRFELSEEVQTTLLHPDQSPPCARSDEAAFQVLGSYDAVWTILLHLTQRMRAVPPKLRASSAGDGGNAAGNMAQQAPFGHNKRQATAGAQSSVPASTSDYTGVVETQYRLLVPEAQVGGLIGKNGENIKKLRAETSARVKVHDQIQGCGERCVQCTSQEDAGSPYVAAIEATINSFHALLLERERQHNTHHIVRMLVQANQIGAVLGRGGAIIKQIRQESGAQLVVLPREAVPPCGMPADEVLQVEGDFNACMSAARLVLVALRGNMIRAQAQQLMPPGFGAGYDTRDTAGPPGIIGSGGFDAASLGPLVLDTMVFGAAPFGDPMSGVYAPPPDILGSSMPGVQTFGNLPPPSFPDMGAPSNSLGFPPPPAPPPPRAPPPSTFGAPPPAFIVPGASFHTEPQHTEHAAPSTERTSYAGTGSSVQVFLQPAQVGAVLGKRGANMQQLRMVSGARVKLHDDPLPTGERQLEISGTLDQVANAQAMVQSMIANSRP